MELRTVTVRQGTGKEVSTDRVEGQVLYIAPIVGGQGALIL